MKRLATLVSVVQLLVVLLADICFPWSLQDALHEVTYTSSSVVNFSVLTPGDQVLPLSLSFMAYDFNVTGLYDYVFPYRALNGASRMREWRSVQASVAMQVQSGFVNVREQYPLSLCVPSDDPNAVDTFTCVEGRSTPTKLNESRLLRRMETKSSKFYIFDVTSYSDFLAKRPSEIVRLIVRPPPSVNSDLFDWPNLVYLNLTVKSEDCEIATSATKLCRTYKFCRQRCGLLCDFESPCPWSFDPPSSENGFRVVTGTEMSGQSGHYAYFGTSWNAEVVAKIVSPYYQHTATHCKLKFRYRLHGMPKTELIVVLESLPDKFNTTRPPMQLKMFPAKTGLVSKWSEEVVSIGQFLWPMRIRLEAWLNNQRPLVHQYNFSADSMIDDISMFDCDEELYHPDSCLSHRTEKYRCQMNKVCIEWDQLCDMSVDCYGGEDEDSRQHHCNKVPTGGRCDFESDSCGWTTTKDGDFRWLRVNATYRQNLEKDDAMVQVVSDHSYSNISGHFMYVQQGNSERMQRAFLVSPKFAPMSKALNDPNSPYYRQCRIRFYYHHFGRDWHSVFLFVVTADESFREKIWEEDKGFMSADQYSYYWQRVSAVIPYQETEYYLQFAAIRIAVFHGDFGLDDISLTPQCFIQVQYKFTTCGAQGITGPTQTMCDGEYNGTGTEVKVLQNRNRVGIQVWKVPATGEYRIRAAGASGGRITSESDRNSGAMINGGAVAEGTFTLTKNDQIWMIVGQVGFGTCSEPPSSNCPGELTKKDDSDKISLPYRASGGGGGTFIIRMNKSGERQFLLAAGGGAGLYSGSGDTDRAGGNGVMNKTNGDMPSQAIPSITGGTGGVTNFKHSTVLPLKNLGRLLTGGFAGSTCRNKHPLKYAGGFGGGGASCGAGGGGGGGFIGGDGGNYSHGEGGWSNSIDEMAIFHTNVHDGPGEVVIVPCLAKCPEGSLCHFVNDSQVCRCTVNSDILSGPDSFCPKAPLNVTEDVEMSTAIHKSNEMMVYVTVIVISGFILVVLLIVFQFKRLDPRRSKKYLDACHTGNLPMDQFLGQNFHSEFNPNYELFRVDELPYSIHDLKEISRSCVKLIRPLGQGAFGEVYEGILYSASHGGNSIPIAVKTLPEFATEQAQMDFHMEALIMSKFNHPNIVQFYGVCFDKMPRFIVLELLAGGDLKSFLRENRPTESSASLEMVDLLNIALDVAQGCHYLEENHFIHRDIAARNCLLTTKDDGRIVKIADFGMARDIYRADYYRKGGKAMLPVKWMPPEAFLDGIFTTKTDVWSYGVLLWEVFSLGYMPYPGRGNQEVMQLVTAGCRLEKPFGCPDKLYRIMCDCWNTHSEKRPDFETILHSLEACLHDAEILSCPLPCAAVHADAFGVQRDVNPLGIDQSAEVKEKRSAEKIPTEGFGINAHLYPKYTPKNLPVTARVSESTHSSSEYATEPLLPNSESSLTYQEDGAVETRSDENVFSD